MAADVNMIAEKDIIEKFHRWNVLMKSFGMSVQDSIEIFNEQFGKQFGAKVKLAEESSEESALWDQI